MFCIKCKYYSQGRCHRYPPANIKGKTKFIYVNDDDWCGEYKTKSSESIASLQCIVNELHKY